MYSTSVMSWSGGILAYIYDGPPCGAALLAAAGCNCVTVRV
jgi:hypothetical protein